MTAGVPMTLWTDDKTERFIVLWNNSALSAAQIGREIGVSRSAVCGKARRLRTLGVIGSRANASHEARNAAQAARPIAAPIPFIRAEEPAPRLLESGAHVTTGDLQTHDCRWPIGDPQDVAFHYCANRAVEGQPYCIFHQLLGFNKAKPSEFQRDKRRRA